MTCVAICTVGELFGGVERHVLGMLNALEAQGVGAVPILFNNGELAARAREQGIEPLVLPASNLSLLATARQLARILQRRDIRLVHAHGYKAMVFCAVARRWHRFAMVKTEHGLPEPVAGHPIGSLRSRIYHLLDRAATRLSGATVCCVTAELLARHGTQAARRRPRVVTNGIAGMERQHSPRPPELRADRFNLTAVGRLEPVKALHLAIEALRAEGLPQDVHLHIVGAGACENELRRRADALGVAARVHFLGFRRDACDFIAHCDALVMPSLHEGLPYTLLEAMALGTPVIASRVGGLAEVVEDGVNGLLFTPGDATGLAGAVLRLIEDPGLRARLGDEAQRVQRARYSLESMARGYLDVYREVLAGSE